MKDRPGRKVGRGASGRQAPGSGSGCLALRSLAALLAALAIGWAAPVGATPPPAASSTPSVQLIETWPVETTLDHPGIPDAYGTWLAMIKGARSTLDFAEFYASGGAGTRLDTVVVAVEAAAKRGVKVRFLAEKGFYKTYPEVLDRLKAQPGIEVRIYDVKPLMGGILHAKYFLVDDAEVYFGSQNFDWRSLTHIQELGLRIHDPAVARSFHDVFDTDWNLAGGGDRTARVAPPKGGYGYPAVEVLGSDTLRVTPVFSPKGWLPDESMWDLPRIVEMIGSARSSVRVQLLTYKAVAKSEYFDALETALRAAAARGVQVQLLLADWCKRPGTIEGLQGLEAFPGIDIKLVTIPEWSGGYIPFGRVIHAKYLVVDDNRSWVGTSNWEKDYFVSSRNVGLIIEGKRTAATLNQFFLDGWNGPYATPVDPCAKYTPPRIGE